MRIIPAVLAVATVALSTLTAHAQSTVIPDIDKVEIGPNREFRVNGKPFLPIMGWLQSPKTLGNLQAMGCNAIAGYWRPTDGSPGAGGGADGYAKIARDKGLYFVAPFEPEHHREMKALRSSKSVLAWIHSDEPDMPKTVSDAKITKGPSLRVNASRALYLMFDGNPKTSAIIDPMVGGSFTITLKAPATVTRFAITNFDRPRMAVAKKVALIGDGKAITTATLTKTHGKPQTIALNAPAKFTALTVRIDEAYTEADSQEWGAILAVEGFDAAGKNVLLSVPRKVTRQSAEFVMARYRQLKAFDRTRPIMMTVTCFFIDDKRFDHWWPTEQADRIYPPLLKATDVMGFDVYPIYGWNQPEQLHWMSQGVDTLRNKYGGKTKPVYVWVETVFGGRFGERAHKVTGVEIRNEVYQAIISGATAIGYFTHQFKPQFAEFGVPEDNQRAIATLNAQLTRLSPVILDADAPRQPTIKFADGLAGRCLGKSHDGWTYIFALNLDMKRRAGKATISLAGLKAGTKVEVVDEVRSITADAGQFSDQFDPLAVHIYRVRQ